jgi:hypothetical protein
MDENKQSYTVKWTQPYTGWVELQETTAEILLENSNWAESAQLIKHIMDLK